MNRLKPLIVCLGFAVAFPGVAAAETTGDYSSLQPKSEMEAAPAYLGQGTLLEVAATVEDVDHKTRLVTLKGPEGGLVTVQAGPEVKNLGQVKNGDQVDVKYFQAMAVNVVSPGENSISAPEVKASAVSAEPGAMPAGAVALAERKTVKILSVDPYKKAISFRGPDGRFREVSMDEPRLEHYLTEIKDGDIVEVVYVEALAVSVTPR